MSDTDVPESAEANHPTRWDPWFGQTEVSRYARIRTAALRLFAEQGVAATSIRMIARAAGVSPGVVQHHFATKEGVRDAVNEYIVQYMRDRLSTLTDAREQDTDELRYLARGAADQEPGALAVLDTVVGEASRHMPRDEAARGVVSALANALFAPVLARYR